MTYFAVSFVVCAHYTQNYKNTIIVHTHYTILLPQLQRYFQQFYNIGNNFPIFFRKLFAVMRVLCKGLQRLGMVGHYGCYTLISNILLDMVFHPQEKLKYKNLHRNFDEPLHVTITLFFLNASYSIIRDVLMHRNLDSGQFDFQWPLHQSTILFLIQCSFTQRIDRDRWMTFNYDRSPMPTAKSAVVTGNTHGQQPGYLKQELSGR